MRSIVTGGAGFIGSHLVERLLADGHEVLVVDDLSSGKPENLPSEAVFEPLDIRNVELGAKVASFRPEILFHLAAQPSVVVSVRDPVLDAQVNVVGAINVLEAAATSGARKVVFSSSGGTVYGDPPPEAIPVPETYTGLPTSPYGISKRVTHDYLAFYKTVREMDFTALALSNVYGPRQDPHGEAGVIAIWSELMLAGQDCPLFGDGEQTRDFVFVSDVVDAFARAATSGGGEIVNIGTGIQTSVNELYRAMAKALGVDREPAYKPARPGELRHIALDITKAERLLGWKPGVLLTDGIATTTSWFAERS
jgi:UDP-glucose 4-epimerase